MNAGQPMSTQVYVQAARLAATIQQVVAFVER
jgi:hypothetical protein